MHHRIVTTLLLSGLLAAAPAWAADAQRDTDHDRKAAAAHRTMAEAHAKAAKCLDAGTPEKTCHAQLAQDCKGAGIGKYCGMKHKH